MSFRQHSVTPLPTPYYGVVEGIEDHPVGMIFVALVMVSHPDCPPEDQTAVLASIDSAGEILPITDWYGTVRITDLHPASAEELRMGINTILDMKFDAEEMAAFIEETRRLTRETWLPDPEGT